MDESMTQAVLTQVFEERQAQESKWGEQNHPNVNSTVAGEPAPMLARWYGIPQANDARDFCGEMHARGVGSYADILIEEVAEAIAACETGDSDVEHELIQVAAVCVAWIEAIRRRRDQPVVADARISEGDVRRVPTEIRNDAKVPVLPVGLEWQAIEYHDDDTVTVRITGDSLT